MSGVPTRRSYHALTLMAQLDAGMAAIDHMQAKPGFLVSSDAQKAFRMAVEAAQALVGDVRAELDRIDNQLGVAETRERPGGMS